MSANYKKLWSDYGIGTIVVLLIVAYAASLFYNYINKKGTSGTERMTQQGAGQQGGPYVSPAGASAGGPRPANPAGQNEVFASVKGVQTSNPGIPSSCRKKTIENPADLLPKDTNSQWAQLNPTGKGELANVNLLKAGYHIGIDTIGQTLRNANLQIRSEPPNPQVYVGPWNQSTIEPDFMRPPFEIAAGAQ
jgi:hypothetical protein